jgi:phosphoglycerate dehydrogenase-like enzyme
MGFRRGEGRIAESSVRPVMPKVLISDALSPAAVQIFKDRGIDVDFQPTLGKDKEKLAAIIGNYDGLAIRSATKVTAKILDWAKDLKVIGRAGIGVDNVDIPAADSGGGRVHACRKMGKKQIHGRRDFRQDAWRRRLR